MSHANHSAAKSLRLRLLEPLLHLGFAFTGVGTVLLGCILPRLSAQWHLRDKDAGLLLLVQFAMSASGALLVRRNLWKTLACGYGLLSGGAVGIFLLQQRSLPAFGGVWTRPRIGHDVDQYAHRPALSQTHGSCTRFAEFFLERRFCGLSSSGRSVSAPCHGQHRLWAGRAAGSTVRAFCHCSRTETIWRSRQLRTGPRRNQRGNNHRLLCASRLSLCGDRSTVGNWMSTYATRTTAWTFAGSTLAVAVFWAALLLGRAMTPAMLTRVPELRLYRASVVATIAGVVLLLAAHTPPTILAGSAANRPCPGTLVPAHPRAFPGGDWRVAQCRLGVCRRRAGRSRTLLVDGDRFHRHRISAHRPAGARRRCPADVGS